MKRHTGLTILVCTLALAVSGCAATTKQSRSGMTVETATAYYEKGRSYEGQNNMVDAAQQYGLAITIEPQFKDATEALVRVEGHLKSQSEVYYQSAVAYESNGLRQKARQHYLIGLRLWPENTKIIEKLTVLPSLRTVTGAYVIHTVQPGESFSLIAKAYYGSLHKYQIIMDFNGIEDASTLRVGQKIKIPGADKAVSSVSQAEEKTVAWSADEDGRQENKGEDEIEADVDQATSYKEHGMEMYEQKLYVEAAFEFEKVLNTDPDDATVIDYVFKSYLEQGKINLKNQDYLGARSQFESALRHQSTCGQCYRYIERSENLYKEDHYKRGLHHYGKQELEQAISEWQLVSNIDPEFNHVNSMIQKAETMLQNLNRIKKK